MAAHHYGSSGLPGEQPPAAAGTHKKKARVALLATAAALLFVAGCVLSSPPLPQTTSTAKFHLLQTNTMQLGAQRQHANRRHPEAAQVEAEATARTS